MNLQENLKGYGQYLPWLLVATLSLALTLKSCSLPQPVPTPAMVTEALPVPVLKKEAKIETAIASGTVKTYKPSIKASLPLPAEVIVNPDKQVTSSNIVQPKETRQIVSQVIDTGTGETTTYVSDGGTPWFAFENRGSVSLDYGFKRQETTPTARFNYRHDLVQIKQIHLGVSASAYSDGDYFVGIGGAYRW